MSHVFRPSSFLKLIWIFVLASCASKGARDSPSAAGAKAPSLEEVAERVIEALKKNDADLLGRYYGPEMAQAFPKSSRESFLKEVSTHLGAPLKYSLTRRASDHEAQYSVTFERATMNMMLATNSKGEVTGFSITQPKRESALLDRNQSAMSLPFDQRMLVFWGGDTAELNHHHDVPSQRYAFDLVGVDDKGRTRMSRSSSNEDYFCFGRPVLAPADGTVVEAIDGVRDNEPGLMNPFVATGNAVILRHSDKEYSLLAHFKNHSLRVKSGQKVKRGQVLGLCGNSGNSSEPHIHFHLQDSPHLAEAVGVKVFFNQIEVAKSATAPLERVQDYSPVKGDVIAPVSGSKLSTTH